MRARALLGVTASACGIGCAYALTADPAAVTPPAASPPPIANSQPVAAVGTAQKRQQLAAGKPAKRHKALKATNKPKYRAHQVVVQFEASATKAERAAVRAAAGAVSHEPLGGDAERLKLRRDADEQQAADRIAGDPQVKSANRPAMFYLSSNDPEFTRQTWLESPIDFDIDAPEAWAASDATTTTPVTVAVIDSGVDMSHPDLASKIWSNTGEYGTAPGGGLKQSNGIDDDGNGYVDDWRGWDFTYNDNNPSPIHWHGTHVSGIIAGERDNSVGIAGVSKQAKVMPLQAFYPAGGSASADEGDIYQAIRYAVDKGAKVVNGSFGSSVQSPLVTSAIAGALSTTFVFAAGNDGHSLESPIAPPGEPSFPCQTAAANVICVGATDDHDNRASFSNFGATQVDLVAPGAGVLSTMPGGLYAYSDGTSMATPVVAGAAALLKSANGSMTPSAIKTRLMATTDPLTASGVAAAGRLNVHRAYANITSVATPTATVSVASGQLRYIAAAGGTNRVTVTGSGTSYTVADTSTNLTPGSGCTAVNAKQVSCTGVTSASITTDDLGDTVSAAIPVNVTVNTGSGGSEVTTGSGNDAVTGGNGRDIVITGNGVDTITLGDGPDWVKNGNFTGNDTIDLGAGDDWAYGGQGTNVITGGPGADILWGSGGTDTIYGGDGDDVVAAHHGDNDALYGDGGDDTLFLSEGNNRQLNGGSGIDSLEYSSYETAVNVELGGTSGNGAAGENHTINTDIENALGGRGDDVIIGSSGPNILLGGPGADLVSGANGDDIISEANDASFEDDELYGGLGTDRVAYARRDDDKPRITASLDGVANDGAASKGEVDFIAADVEGLEGDNGADTLIGNSAANLLIGGQGDDVLRGGGGTDTYVGGEVFEPTAGATAGFDAVSYSDKTTAVTASLDGAANDGASGENENIPSSIDKIVGGTAGDTLTAGSYSATLEGGTGVDTLTGGAAADVILSRDSATDATVNCGGAADHVVRDSSDPLAADCETNDATGSIDTVVTSGPANGSTVNNEPTFAFAASPASGATFECGTGATPTWTPCTSPWTAPVGPHGTSLAYSVRATGPNGAVDATPAVRTLSFDYAAPAAAFTGGPADGSNVATSTATFTFAAPAEPGLSYECRLDYAKWSPCTSPWTTSELSDGEYRVDVRAKDSVGNVQRNFVTRTFHAVPFVSVSPGTATPASVGLTNDTPLGEAIDWNHWTATVRDRSSGPSLIGNWSTLGGGATSTIAGPSSFSWTDAAGSTPSGSSSSGVARGTADGSGLRTVISSMSTQPRALKVHVGVRGVSTTGTLTATQSGVPAVTQTVTSSSNTTVTNRTFVIAYRGTTTFADLQLDWVQTAGGTNPSSAVVLYAEAVY